MMLPINQWLQLLVFFLLQGLGEFFIQKVLLLHCKCNLLKCSVLDESSAITTPDCLDAHYLPLMRLKQASQLFLLEGLQLRDGLILESKSQAISLTGSQGLHIAFVVNEKWVEVVLWYRHGEL